MLAITTFRGPGLGFPFEKVGTVMLLGSLGLMGLAAYAVAQRKKSGLRGSRVYAKHVRLNRGGYDTDGRYWGVGEKLYRTYRKPAGTVDEQDERYVRAPSAVAARRRR